MDDEVTDQLGFRRPRSSGCRRADNSPAVRDGPHGLLCARQGEVAAHVPLLKKFPVPSLMISTMVPYFVAVPKSPLSGSYPLTCGEAPPASLGAPASPAFVLMRSIS